MTSKFLKFYISNMGTLYREIFRNQRSIQVLNEKIKTLTVDVVRRFKIFIGDMMKKPRLREDDESDSNAKIKVIYLLIRQIQKWEAEKRSMTKEACNILDKYLASLGREAETTDVQHDNADDELGPELLQTLSSITLALNQPMEGNAVIVDLIKKIEVEKVKNADEESSAAIVNEDKNVEMVTETDNTLSISTYGDVAKHLSDLIYRMDNLQVFTDKVFDICLEMRNRYGVKELSTVDPEAVTINKEEPEEEEEYELCHCRTQEFGKMVACDNTKCKIRWYHFECVALYRTPVGAWFCPRCIIFENVGN